MISRLPHSIRRRALSRFHLSTISIFCFLIVGVASGFSQENSDSNRAKLGLRIRAIPDPRASLQSGDEWRGMSMVGYNGILGWARPRSYIHSVKADTSGKFVVASETILGEYLRLPQVIPFDDFQRRNLQMTRQNLWHTNVVKNLYAADLTRRKGSGGLSIDIPVPIKNQTFQKIFGGNTVGLNVQGDIRIEGGFRKEDRSEVRTSIAQGSNTNFKMNQTQRFTVTGKIGEKVTVNVDQDSERAFDFENNIKLNYKGFDDEVIQSIEAGNISLNLPATRFVTFSGKSTGLFGVKMNMQLGDLHITSIASQEKGQSQKLKVGGGATEGKLQIKDHQYKRYTYFFLDNFYRQQYRVYSQRWVHVYRPEKSIARIEIYKSRSGLEYDPNAIRGWALLDPDNARTDTLNVSDKEVYVGHFLRLEAEKDYFIENNLGYIIMNQALNPDEVLAVAYQDSSGNIVGDIDFVADSTSSNTIILRLIKAQSPTPSYKSWDLEWKNVYYLGGRNIDTDGDNFDVKIFYQPASGSDEESQTTQSYLNIFGLDERDVSGNFNPDNKIDTDDNILNRARGELILPNLRPFDPDTVFIDKNGNGIGDPGEEVISALKPDRREPAIYDTTSQNFITQNSRFYFEVKSKNRSATYQLGFNVIESSEKVILNGSELKRGSGYTIDYWSGTLTLLDERATDANAQLDITYERNQLFQLEKKTILGTRAEYKFGPDAFIGGTLLYLNERTIEQKVRVGGGPMQNLVWDLNTSFKLKSDLITRAVDALPFVRARQPSTLNFEGEIAQVLPNPNTLNSPATGDNDGVAYIDDFESAKRTTPLGIQRRGWTLASAPVDYVDGSSTENYWRSVEKMGSLNWYNPFGGFPIRSIWPNREVNAQTGQTTDVLFMIFAPQDAGGFPPQDSWAGVQRALSPGFFDQTETKFLEVMVYGNKGILHIDLGQISEDVIPNKELDTEDKKVGGIRNGLLDPDEDTGLDGMFGSDPDDWWDINKNGVRDPFEPISFDDWFYTSGSRDYDRINGTENNANDGERRPDTEDINGNGSVDLANNYFEYTFNLDKFSPDTVFIGGGDRTGEDTGWALYRIPLFIPEGYQDGNRKRVGNPDLSLIEYARVWVSGITDTAVIGIAEINLVGNEWRELGISDSEDPGSYTGADSDTTVKVTIINSFDNPEYVSPPGVEGVRDRITLVTGREQSLVIDVNGLDAGYNGIIRKSFFEPQNYIRYKRMRMFVFGKDEGGKHIFPDTSSIEFFLRFGSDDRNYYEVREMVYAGPDPILGAWDTRNEIDIDFFDLTSMKLDSANYNPIEDYFERRVGNKRYRIKGNPSITNIRILTGGVKNVSDQMEPFYGQIWMNELRLSEVQKDKGVAMRARLDFALSDFININGEVNRQDAEFHNIGTRFGSGDNRLSASVNGTVRLDKMLPQKWGFSIPVNLNYNQSNSTPKYFPGRDIEVVEGELPDSTLEEIKTANKQQGISVSFRKNTRSKNFVIRNTLDNLTANLSNTESLQSSPTMNFAKRSVWTGSVDYRLQFGQKTFIQPLKLFMGFPLLKKLAETRIYYFPRNVGLKVQGNNSRVNSETRLGVKSDVYTYDITRSINTTYKVFESLSTTFSRSHVGDFRDKQWQGLFSGDYVDLRKTQNFKVDYSPQIFSWMPTKFSYSANFRYTNNIQQPVVGKSAGTSANISANATLKLSQLFKRKSSRGTTGRRAPPGKRRAPPGGRQQPGKEKEKDKKKDNKADEKKAKGINPLNALRLVGHVFGRFKDINVTYSQRQDYRNLGLEEGSPSMRYALGLTTDPGLGTVPDITTVTFTQNQSRNLSISSGAKLTRSIDISLRFNHTEQENITTQTTGSYSTTWLQIGDFSMPFPEWTLNWTNIEKFPILKGFAKTISLSHNGAGKRSILWKDKRAQKTKSDFSFSFRPLLKVSVNWKNGMVSNLQINKSRTINESFNVNATTQELQKVGGQRTTQQDISFSTTYSKRSGFRIPFLSKKELKNSLDFSLTFSSSQALTENIRGLGGEWQLANETVNWTVEPKITYSFSSRVRGGTKFIYGKRKSTRAGETTIKELAIDVNISIRGS